MLYIGSWYFVQYGPQATKYLPHVVPLVSSRDPNTLELMTTSSGRQSSVFTKESKDAEPHLIRALGVAERVLGSDHPDIATTLTHLAVVAQKQGRMEEAVAFQLRALSIEEQSFGVEHPALVPRLVDLAALRHQSGVAEESEALRTRIGRILSARCAPATNGDRGACEQALAAVDRGSSRAESPPPVRASRSSAPPPRATTAEERSAQPSRTRPAGPAQRRSTSPPPPPPAPEPRTEPRGEVYRVQLAARRERGQAETKLSELRAAHGDLLAALPSRIERVQLEGRGTWHRIQFGAFGSRSAAMDLCRRLEARGVPDCWAVKGP